MSRPARAVPEGLSPALKALVKRVEAALGRVAAEAEGPAFLRAIERVRRLMVLFRGAGPAGRASALARAERLLSRLPPGRRAAFARAYTLYLELVNVCENAYRTHRLRRRAEKPSRARADVVYVLTAHPTESRSPENIRLLRRVQDLLVEGLARGRPPEPAGLAYLLNLAWRAGTHSPRKPAVADEARHIFSLLGDSILDELLDLRRRGHRVRLRTWVGGDRDGHPGVGPEETRASLSLSRERLLAFVEARLLPDLPELEAPLKSLRDLSDGDGARLVRLKSRMAALAARERKARGAGHPALERLGVLLELFPGLVVPLELREERGRFTPGSPIAAMMGSLRRVARGGRPDWYVRGCVVSMTVSADDLRQARALVGKCLGGGAIPVIPLFETPAVLPRAPRILASAFPRGGRVEVMLGYSDTAKRMGVFPSRVAILEAMHAIGRWGARAGARLVYFQGAGGSEGRGGGTIEEQAATWPRGALSPLKMTLQGEMIERTLATPEILRGQVEKIAAIQAAPPAPRAASPFSRRLARAAQEAFARRVGEPDLRALLQAATPYAHLGALTIGSRPARRPGRQADVSLEGLRAIPWVLCWTQVRYLLPVWLGVGQAWSALAREPGAKAALRRALAADPLLRSFARLLGFSMAKTEPDLWLRYVARLAPGVSPALAAALERDRRSAERLARLASPGGTLLADRPWLAESIRYRAPMIHPLNLLQILVLEKKRWGPREERLFRETVTGIAAGMLTTG